jgi:hypothetical protein
MTGYDIFAALGGSAVILMITYAMWRIGTNRRQPPEKRG